MKEYQKPIVIVDEMMIEDVVLNSAPALNDDELKMGEGAGERW